MDADDIQDDNPNPDHALSVNTRSTRTSKRTIQSILTLSTEKKMSFSRPVLQRKKKSVVWKYIKVHPDDRNSHICKLCNRIIASTGNTTNSRKHLANHHAGIWEEALLEEEADKDDEINIDSQVQEPDSQVQAGQEHSQILENVSEKRLQKIKLLLKSKRVYENNSSKKQKLDESLARKIAEDYLPYSVVDRQGEIRHSLMLNERYIMPDRNTLATKLIPQLYEKLETKLAERISGARYIAITFDGWTSLAQIAYLTVTGHFIPKDAVVIETVTLCLINSSAVLHSAKEYANQIRHNVIKRFKMTQNNVKIVCCTTDNAANVKATAKELGIKHLGCYDHTLQLVVNDVLFPKKKTNTTIEPELELLEQDLFEFVEEDILRDLEPGASYPTDTISLSLAELIRRLKSIAAFFHRSTKASAYLRKECAARGYPFYTIVQCVVTRWNSLYHMIERIEKCYDCIKFVLVSLDSKILPFSSEDMAVIREMLLCLRPFANHTEELGHEKRVSISLLLTNIGILLNELASVKQQVTTEEGKLLIDGLTTRAKERLLVYENVSVVVAASILDPRIKYQGFQNMKNYNYGVEELKKEISAMIKYKETICPTDNRNAINRETPEKNNSKYASFLSQKQRPSNLLNSNRTVASATIQLNNYLSEPPVEFDMLENPITFWREYPPCELQQIALKYLIIPATSTASERVASSAGLTISTRRTKLLPEHANELIFIKKNSYLLDL